MSSKLGLDGKFYRNTGTYASPTWVEIANVKDVTLNVEAGEADVTTRANAGWKATLATLKDGSVEFDMVWDTGDAGFEAIKNAFFGNTTIEVAVMDGLITASGSQGLRATMSVTKFSRKEPLADAIQVAVTMKPGYAANPPDWLVVA